MKAKSIKGYSTSEIKAALTQCMSDGFKPTLALAFSSISQDLRAISELLDEKGVAVFGITTNGEFIDEETEKGSIAMLLIDINKDYFHIYLEEYPEKNYQEVAIEIAEKAKNKFKSPAFLIGTSNSETDGEEILRGFEKIIGNNVTAFGASAGDDYRFEETFVFSNKEISKNGLLCLVINEEKVEVNGIEIGRAHV